MISPRTRTCRPAAAAAATLRRWSRAEPLGYCQGAHKNTTDYNLFNTMVAPLLNTTVSTLLWYQVSAARTSGEV